MSRACMNAWRDRVGRSVVFSYPHGERVTGTITSVGTRFVFVNFGAAHSEACDPDWLELESDA